MKSNGKSRKRHRVEDGPTPAERKWAKRIAAWRQSGLAATAFCKRRGLNESSLRHWVKELRRRERVWRRTAGGKPGRKPGSTMKFVTARLVGVGSTAPYELTLKGGRTLRIRGDFEEPALRRLVAALEAV